MNDRERGIDVGQVIWMAILTSPLVLLAVVWAGTDPASPAAEGIGDPVVLILGLVALGLLYAGAKGVDSLIPRVPGADGTQQELVVLIIRLALFEAIAILGLAAGLVTGNITAYLPFMFLSLVGIILSRPRRQ